MLQTRVASHVRNLIVVAVGSLGAPAPGGHQTDGPGPVSKNKAVGRWSVRHGPKAAIPDITAYGSVLEIED